MPAIMETLSLNGIKVFERNIKFLFFTRQILKKYYPGDDSKTPPYLKKML